MDLIELTFEFSLLKNKKWKKKWYGADFIAGSNLFFENLYKSIKPIYKKFQKNFDELKNRVMSYFFHQQ